MQHSIFQIDALHPPANEHPPFQLKQRKGQTSQGIVTLKYWHGWIRQPSPCFIPSVWAVSGGSQYILNGQCQPLQVWTLLLNHTAKTTHVSAPYVCKSVNTFSIQVCWCCPRIHLHASESLMHTTNISYHRLFSALSVANFCHKFLSTRCCDLSIFIALVTQSARSCFIFCLQWIYSPVHLNGNDGFVIA